MSGRNARERISGSAAALFQRFGYTRVSIRDITSYVNIPKGSFYNHFSSKEALAAAILSHHFNALLETLTRDGNESVGSRLRRHFESIAPRAQQPKTSPLRLISTLAAEGPALPPALAHQIAEGIRLWSSKVAALVSLAQARGQVDAGENPDLPAALLINCWQGAMIRDKCDPSARHDCLRLALDRILGPSRRDGRGTAEFTKPI